MEDERLLLVVGVFEVCRCPSGSHQFTHRIWGQQRGCEGESTSAKSPWEGLVLTAQQRRIMPRGAGHFDRFGCNVWLGCAKADQHNI